jgi:hypothetical protein
LAVVIKQSLPDIFPDSVRPVQANRVSLFDLHNALTS